MQKLDIKDIRPNFLHPEDQTKKHVLLDPCYILKLLSNAFSTAEVLETQDGKHQITVHSGTPKGRSSSWQQAENAKHPVVTKNEGPPSSPTVQQQCR